MATQKQSVSFSGPAFALAKELVDSGEYPHLALRFLANSPAQYRPAAQGVACAGMSREQGEPIAPSLGAHCCVSSPHHSP